MRKTKAKNWTAATTTRTTLKWSHQATLFFSLPCTISSMGFQKIVLLFFTFSMPLWLPVASLLYFSLAFAKRPFPLWLTPTPTRPRSTPTAVSTAQTIDPASWTASLSKHTTWLVLLQISLQRLRTRLSHPFLAPISSVSAICQFALRWNDCCWRWHSTVVEWGPPQWCPPTERFCRRAWCRQPCRRPIQPPENSVESQQSGSEQVPYMTINEIQSRFEIRRFSTSCTCDCCCWWFIKSWKCEKKCFN